MKVCTTKQLAAFYGCDEKAIRQNFINNNERFEEGKHFFKVEGGDLREFKSRVDNFDSVDPRVKSLMLWTEKGAARKCFQLDC